MARRQDDRLDLGRVLDRPTAGQGVLEPLFDIVRQTYRRGQQLQRVGCARRRKIGDRAQVSDRAAHLGHDLGRAVAAQIGIPIQEDDLLHEPRDVRPPDSHQRSGGAGVYGRVDMLQLPFLGWQRTRWHEAKSRDELEVDDACPDPRLPSQHIARRFGRQLIWRGARYKGPRDCVARVDQPFGEGPGIQETQAAKPADGTQPAEAAQSTQSAEAAQAAEATETAKTTQAAER